MAFEEIEPLLNLLFRYGIEGAIAGLIVFLLVKHFLPGYLSQKGKNLATQEDIEIITDKVESVKSGYAEVLEEVKSNNQIKIAAIEREKSLKKEVFMEAAEALTNSLNMIANFSNLNLSEEALTSGFSSEAGKIAKVQIVGEGRTVRAVTTIMSSVGEATLTLMLERGSLINRKNLIEINEKQRDKAQAEVERYISIMKNLNLQGNTDQGLWDTINRAVDCENGQIEKYNNEIDSLWDAQNKEHLVYVSKCMDTFFDISVIFPEAILAVREELDLNISPDEYLDIYNKNIEKGRSVFKSFLEKAPNA
ncbi:chromosome segregation ATPase [Shewanella algae]|uniref:chromosome segregation ATPase n=1 Tax=Shewanella algae TaxID=38313 RepID=UPI003004CB27